MEITGDRPDVSFGCDVAISFRVVICDEGRGKGIIVVVDARLALAAVDWFESRSLLRKPSVIEANLFAQEIRDADRVMSLTRNAEGLLTFITLTASVTTVV